MSNRKAWSDDECRAVVSLYFAMLDKAVAGEKYNKAAMIRLTQADTAISPKHFAQPFAGKLKDRTRGSIEAKLMNCSAAHASLDPHADTMDAYGYRALSNYQKVLKDVMRTKLEQRAIFADPALSA